LPAKKKKAIKPPQKSKKAEGLAKQVLYHAQRKEVPDKSKAKNGGLYML